MRRAVSGILVTIAAALVLSGCGGDAGGASVQEAAVHMRYSAFEPGEIVVRAGQPVVITIENGDPITHEWIVGTSDVHDRHRTGTEPFHDQIPSEVTVPAFEMRKTMLTFEVPGEYQFICHLPGHEAYGMAGTLRVVD
jgi:uncharacterized cupredoxin-like copper-binding protein